MNRREFMAALSAALSDLVPAGEKNDILRYYEEYFDDAGPDREAEVIRSLGDPAQLARKIAREGGYRTDEPGSGKRRIRPWIFVVAAVVVVIAAIVIQIAVSQAVNRGSHQDVPGAATAQMPSSAGNEEAEPLQQFQSVDVEVAVADVTLRTGDSFSVSLEWNRERNYTMSYELRGDVLKVSSQKLSTSGIDMGNYESRVVITVPEGTALEQIEIETGLGGITVTGVSAAEMELQTGLGDVTADGVLVQGDLTMNTGLGDVTLLGAPAADMTLESGMGNIRAELSCAAADCGYQLESGMGTIRLDGQEFKDSVKKKDGRYELEAATGMGDIDVRFAG